MKKTILVFVAVLVASSSVFAQNKKPRVVAKNSVATAKAATAAPAPQNTAENAEAMKFKTTAHDFGTIAEGPSVSYDFEFTNTSKQPIQLESVKASCGCTTPNWSKDPILPGKTSKITATYSTQGRPNGFHKTITVQSNVGQKVLTISGNVEKAPTSSVPANTNSMIKN